MNIPVRIVLVETSHPGNIGAAARAMKTMGLVDLALVRPKHFPSEEATARASGADDLLQRARVFESLPEAIADCRYVVGASARLRAMRWPVDDPRAMAQNVWRQLAEGAVAIALGPEQSGLTNEDMLRCHALVHIPTAPDYGSLNLAMAVQVLCYELRMAPEENRISEPESRDAQPATAAELEGFHAHLEQVLWDARFLHPDHPKQLRLKLRRLFTRAALDRNEINILRGALAALSTPRRPGDAEAADRPDE
jgi:tRNA (cytidine32/uridine32-2'-O)-methyltransferase